MTSITSFGLIVAGIITLIGTLIGLMVKRGDDKMARYDNGLWKRIAEQDERIKQLQADADAKDTKIDNLQTRVDALLQIHGELREENTKLKIKLAEEQALREALERRVSRIGDAAASN